MDRTKLARLAPGLRAMNVALLLATILLIASGVARGQESGTRVERKASVLVEASASDAEALPWDRRGVPIVGPIITDQLFSTAPDIELTVLWLDSRGTAHVDEYHGAERPLGSHRSVCDNRFRCRFQVNVPGGASFALIAGDLDPAVDWRTSARVVMRGVRHMLGDTAAAMPTVKKPLLDARRWIAGYLFRENGDTQGSIDALQAAVLDFLARERFSASPQVRLPVVDAVDACTSAPCSDDEANVGTIQVTHIVSHPLGHWRTRQ